MKPDILKLAVQSLRRDWRSGEIRLIAIAIVIAVASLTSVGFFTDRVKRASESQATELLAADLVIQSRQPVADEVREMIRSAGLVETDITSMRSMVMAGENLQMAEVKAVEAERVGANLLSAESTEKLPSEMEGLHSSIERLQHSLEAAKAYVDAVVVSGRAVVL